VTNDIPEQAMILESPRYASYVETFRTAGVFASPHFCPKWTTTEFAGRELLFLERIIDNRVVSLL
jgi:hypothetical protein